MMLNFWGKWVWEKFVWVRPDLDGQYTVFVESRGWPSAQSVAERGIAALTLKSLRGLWKFAWWTFLLWYLNGILGNGQFHQDDTVITTCLLLFLTFLTVTCPSAYYVDILQYVNILQYIRSNVLTQQTQYCFFIPISSFTYQVMFPSFNNHFTINELLWYVLHYVS